MMKVCQYIVELTSECFNNFPIQKLIINYIDRNENIIFDRNENIILDVNENIILNRNENILIEINKNIPFDKKKNTPINRNRGNENIDLEKYNFNCGECQQNIIGEMYMFNDNSFCNTKCRKKSMDKICDNT